MEEVHICISAVGLHIDCGAPRQGFGSEIELGRPGPAPPGNFET